MFKLILLLLFMSPVIACEDHLFFRVGAGAQGQWMSNDEWDGDDKLAAAFAAGYRSPIKNWVWWDIQATHNSQWFQGPPFDDQDEDELTAVTLGLEFRFYED